MIQKIWRLKRKSRRLYLKNGRAAAIKQNIYNRFYLAAEQMNIVEIAKLASVSRAAVSCYFKIIWQAKRGQILNLSSFLYNIISQKP